MEVFKILVEYVSNGALDDLRLKYGYLAPDILTDIKHLAVSLPTSLANNSSAIIVKKQHSDFIGEVDCRHLFLNMDLVYKEPTYRRKKKPDGRESTDRIILHTFVSAIGDRVRWDGSFEHASKIDLQVDTRYDFRATIAEHRKDTYGKYTRVTFLKVADDIMKAEDASLPVQGIPGG